mmetsp:Transcript_65375/g.75164  ORF Transcript_65375/g.75164 Transcript_65375/m.75164 type:complete len:138 (-) Transcript_65375:320-733(-)
MELGHIMRKLFIAGGVLAFLSCFARSDFNLPLFIFLYFTWDEPRFEDVRIHTIVFTAFTLLLDFIWLCYWGPYWSSQEFVNDWENGIHSFVVFTSAVNFIVKIIIVVMMCADNVGTLKEKAAEIKAKTEMMKVGLAR